MEAMGDYNHEAILRQIPEDPKEQRTFLVLTSGGVDSSTLLWLSAQQGLGADRSLH